MGMSNSPPAANSAAAQKGDGLPARLKSAIEDFAKVDLSDVRVHYNSSKPAQLQAHAYAQGTDIHIAAGQEKHLAHEVWHVVQQKQGRVKPVTNIADVKQLNDNPALEKEADTMGARFAPLAN
ncbi:DUF4157 domain-containing protein [Aeoliella sp.]|uniref:eCIS core domain-containing protein n=1 Tax=Aeoliella sp. TaxID=2795800 RepID=UPI003CCB8DB2